VQVEACGILRDARPARLWVSARRRRGRRDGNADHRSRGIAEDAQIGYNRVKRSERSSAIANGRWKEDEMTVVAAKVTARGVLVPRALIAAWGDVREVEIEKHADTVVIRPRPAEAAPWRGQVIGKMKAAGLIEEMPWPEPPVVSPEARARLAAKLSHGKPLSELIQEDREEYA
jgi:hypothetical protein